MNNDQDERNWPTFAEGSAWPTPAEGRPPETRERELEAALHALVAVEPLYADREDWENCVYCEASLRPSVRGPLTHKDDCPWVRARGLLAEKGDG